MSEEVRKRKREQEEQEKNDAAFAAQIALNEEGYEIIEYDTTFAFCCYNCRCGKNKTDRHGLTIDKHNQNMYLHRLCCHNRPKSDEGRVWGECPLARTIERSLKKKNPKNKTFAAVQVLDVVTMQNCHRQALIEEKKIKRELEDADPSSIWYTNEQNTAYAVRYNIRILSQKRKTRAVVLEVFAGVGSGLVTLKRLKIDMKKVISVEHDEFANFVRKANHPGQEEGDGIEYHDILTFEEIEENYGEMLERHGAIDIVIAGPPCSDYSAVNAKRKGVDGLRGSYLLRFGTLMQNIQDHELQQGHPLYVVCENVTISEKDGLSKVENHLRCTGNRIDSKYFSPCKRDRMYFTTFPTGPVNYDSPDAEYSAGKHFYKNEWMHLSEACGINSQQTTLKANTFMASEGRIDDYPRMWKARLHKQGKFEVQALSVEDREKMMGFPDGYVGEPLKNLFEKMTTSLIDSDWTKNMPEMSEFSGLPFSYNTKEDPPYFELKAGPPLPENQKTQYYFNASGYAKHLIGNAFSIPVMEHLMRPLAQLYASREYDGYSYPFPWPPHNLGIGDEFSYI